MKAQEFLYKRIHPSIIGKSGREYKYRMLEKYKYSTGIIPKVTGYAPSCR